MNTQSAIDSKFFEEKRQATPKFKTFLWLILIILTGFLIRLIALPFTMNTDPDAVSRIWIAWNWLSSPSLITAGVWGPLHTYLLAVPLAISHDPVFAPVVLHMAFSVATAIPLYFFTRNEFGNRRAALLVAALWMFEPIVFRNSLMAIAETPYAFFLAACLYFLSMVRRKDGNWKHALGAGICLLLAEMLRYEAWLLLPLLGISLFRKPRLMIIFGLTAALFPAFWMAGSFVQYSDPLYSIHSTGTWEVVEELSNQLLTSGELIRRVVYYPLALFLGLTPIVSLLATTGIIVALIKRAATAVWLLPILALMGLFTVGAAQGTLSLHSRYTVPVVVFVLPFIAGIRGSLMNILKLSNNRRAIFVGAGLIVSMLVLSYAGNFVGPQVTRKFFETSINPVPRLDDAETLAHFSEVVNLQLDRNREGLISDFYDYSPTYYIALLTRLPPNQIYLAPTTAVADMDVKPVSEFVNHYPNGLIILQDNSRFAHSLNFDQNKLMFDGKVMLLELLDNITSEHSNIRLYRYHIEANS